MQLTAYKVFILTSFFVSLPSIRNKCVCRHNINLEVHSILCPTLWNFDNFTNQWRGQVEKVLPWIRIIVTRYTFKVRLYLSWFVIGQSKASQVSRIWWGLTSFCINKDWLMIMRIFKIIACCIFALTCMNVNVYGDRMSYPEKRWIKNNV